VKAWIQTLQEIVGAGELQQETSLQKEFNFLLRKLEEQQTRQAVNLEILRSETDAIHDIAVPELRSFASFKKETIRELSIITAFLTSLRNTTDPVWSEIKSTNELLREIELNLIHFESEPMQFLRTCWQPSKHLKNSLLR
jgi:hypothetical protein